MKYIQTVTNLEKIRQTSASDIEYYIKTRLICDAFCKGDSKAYWTEKRLADWLNEEVKE